MRRLIYKEDHQMYYFYPVTFETDSELTTDEMSRISHEMPGAGTFSTPFSVFAKLMRGHGYIVNEIEIGDRNTIPENNILEIVKGTRGNY